MRRRRRCLPPFFFVVGVVIVVAAPSALGLFGSQSAFLGRRRRAAARAAPSSSPSSRAGPRFTRPLSSSPSSRAGPRFTRPLPGGCATPPQAGRRHCAIVPALLLHGGGATCAAGRPNGAIFARSSEKGGRFDRWPPHCWPVLPPSLSLRAGGGADTPSSADDEPGDPLTGDIPSPHGPIVEYSVEQDDDEDDCGADHSPRRRVVVLMDCFTPYLGLYVANRIRADYRNVAVVYVLGDYLRVYSALAEPDDADRWEAARIPGGTRDDPDDKGDDQDARRRKRVEEWKGRVFPGRDRRAVEWVGVYSESDSGLADAERLRLLLNVTCRDDPDVLPDRRHKYLMNERVREIGGLATARQRLCSSLPELLDVAREELREPRRAASALDEIGTARTRVPRVIVKPFRGCGTESVYLCESLEQVSEAWETITNSTVFGAHERHTTALAQEFLEGVEYAVDVVARDGSYKVAAVWRYDKRPANGAPFCYFRTGLVDPESDPVVPAVAEYVLQSLVALGVRWGISHNEVIVTSDRGPVLVEVNCRQHNMDFCPITMCCVGYNALDMMVEAMLGTESDWDKYPDQPALRASGSMVHLVNYATGRLVEVSHLDVIAHLSSAFNLEVYDHFASPGSRIEPTVDIKTDAGWVQLVNDDDEALERDYAEIVRLMPTMFRVE